MRQYDDMTTKAEDKLEEALALLAAGIPLDDILAETGADEAWLRPMLEIAAEVDQMQQQLPLPPPAASLNKMLAHAETLAAAGAPPQSPGWLAGLAAIFGRTGAPLALGVRAAALAMSLTLAFLAGTILGGSLTAAAHDSLPGQPLYGLKRAAETLRLNLTWSPAKREDLIDAYNHRRRLEAELLLEQEQSAMVAFDSEIQSVAGSTLMLTGGLTVQLTGDTAITGDLTSGARIHLQAETHSSGVMRALRVTVIEPGPATPTPTAVPSPTPRPTATRSQASDTLILPSLDDVPDEVLEEDNAAEQTSDEDNTTDSVPVEAAPDDRDDIDEPDDDRDGNENEADDVEEDNGSDIEDDMADDANENEADLDNEDSADDFTEEDDDLDDGSNDNTGDDLDNDGDDFEDEAGDDIDDDSDDFDDDFEDNDSDDGDDSNGGDDHSGSGSGSDDNSGSSDDEDDSGSDSDDESDDD